MNLTQPLILASSSPRRQYLMRQAGFTFTVRTPDIDESFPATMPAAVVPGYLAEKKARVFEAELQNEIVLASDTVVILENEILNKPVDRTDALTMLSKLSGKTHTVITAVCILSKNKCHCFDDCTEVTFRSLSANDIAYYIDTFKPMDKAGAYGAQDCLPENFNPCSKQELEFLARIGKSDLIAQTITRPPAGTGITIIDKINGSYFTVMGLPIHLVYDNLISFV
ncbi:MAG: septum formation protein Maf [Cyclobacteriaceae bacterium]|nr:septum formation protein Maf [Cyclobacteriaceae bacterium]